MFSTWIVGSFFKTKSKLEWAVAPVLVVMAFTVGMLNAIFLGVAMSTFIFAANFYRAGTVKYVGSGLTLRSTVERGAEEAAWLNQNADRIQILVLNHYLFFGNAQSIWTYTTTMFDDDEDDSEELLPPVPAYLSTYFVDLLANCTLCVDRSAIGTDRHLLCLHNYAVVDFTMVGGIDTTAVDIFRDVIELCKENHCRLFVAGLAPKVKSDFFYAGLKPGTGPWGFVYAADLESALARAEDGLLSNVYHLEQRDELEASNRRRERNESDAEDGFLYSLKKIDEQHNLDTAEKLIDFRQYTEAIELAPDDVLFRDSSDDDGLYFIETGHLKVRHASGHSTMRRSFSSETLQNTPTPSLFDPTSSIGHLDARSDTLGRKMATWKKNLTRSEQQRAEEHSFRLQRIGQGWIIGSIDSDMSGAGGAARDRSVHVAITRARLHHLPLSAIREAERTHPALAMNLYKTVSYLSNKRQEMTIHQLGQFIRIMNAPVPRLRGGRSALAKLQEDG